MLPYNTVMESLSVFPRDHLERQENLDHLGLLAEGFVYFCFSLILQIFPAFCLSKLPIQIVCQNNFEAIFHFDSTCFCASMRLHDRFRVKCSMIQMLFVRVTWENRERTGRQAWREPRWELDLTHWITISVHTQPQMVTLVSDNFRVLLD